MPLLSVWSGAVRGVTMAPLRKETPPAAEASMLCGAPGCTSAWLKPWKNRRRPVLEGSWACSRRCLTALVRAAVEREMPRGVSARSTSVADDTPHRHRVPLGLVLLAQGAITHPQLIAALSAQRTAGEGRVGDWLMQQTGLSEERLMRGVGVQWNCPLLSLEGFSARAMALVMPKRLVVELGLLPVRIAGSSVLYVAFPERRETAAALALGRMSGLRVECGLLPESHFAVARERLLAADAVAVRMHAAVDSDALTQSLTKLIAERQPAAARVVRVHRYLWLRMWLEEGAHSPGVPLMEEDVEDHLFVAG